MGWSKYGADRQALFPQCRLCWSRLARLPECPQEGTEGTTDCISTLPTFSLNLLSSCISQDKARPWLLECPVNWASSHFPKLRSESGTIPERRTSSGSRSGILLTRVALGVGGYITLQLSALYIRPRRRPPYSLSEQNMLFLFRSTPSKIWNLFPIRPRANSY